MAITHSNSTPAFLVFPSSNPVFTWVIRATETNRFISRHKNLDRAVRKAERLNVEAIQQPLLRQCQHEEVWDEVYGFQCEEIGTVYDRERESEFCVKHFLLGVRHGL